MLTDRDEPYLTALMIHSKVTAVASYKCYMVAFKSVFYDGNWSLSCCSNGDHTCGEKMQISNSFACLVDTNHTIGDLGRIGPLLQILARDRTVSKVSPCFNSASKSERSKVSRKVKKFSNKGHSVLTLLVF